MLSDQKSGGRHGEYGYGHDERDVDKDMAPGHGARARQEGMARRTAGYTICSGWKTSSKRSGVSRPSATQASLSDVPSAKAFLATRAALS